MNPKRNDTWLVVVIAILYGMLMGMSLAYLIQVLHL